MAVDIRANELKLVREADGLEIDLLPLQGLWTEEQYLRLTDQTNRFIEFTEGAVEILPMPTRKHRIPRSSGLDPLVAALHRDDKRDLRIMCKYVRPARKCLPDRSGGYAFTGPGSADRPGGRRSAGG